MKLVIFLFTFLISYLFTIFQDSRLEQAGVGPGGANSSSEGVLANFFNSLLSKKTAGQPGTPSNQIKPTTGLDDCKSNSNRKLTVFKPFKTDYRFADKAVRSDAAAELDRLTRGTQKKASNSGHNSMDNNSLNNSSSEC